MAFITDLVTGFTFRKIQSPIHRLDPRSKLIIAISFSVISLLFTRFVQLLALFLCMIPLLFVAKVHRLWIKSLKRLVLFAVLIFAVDMLFYWNLDLSLAMTLRFLTLTTAFSIFFLTTLPDELGLMLEKMHVPYDISFAFVGSVRFVPIIANETVQIIESHHARGFELKKGGLLKRLRRYVPIIVTVIVNAIKRSNELAESLESKAFGAKKERVNLYELRMRVWDYLCIVLAIAAIVAAFYINSLVPVPTVRIWGL